MNIKSPTGCVHRSVIKFDDKTHSTLCNHSTGGDGGYFLSWPEAKEPVTCKRCLSLMRTSHAIKKSTRKPELICKRCSHRFVCKHVTEAKEEGWGSCHWRD